MAFSLTCDRQPSFRSAAWENIERFARNREQAKRLASDAEEAARQAMTLKERRRFWTRRNYALEAKRRLQWYRLQARRPAFRRIAEEVAEEHGFSVATLLSNSRRRPYARARFKLAWRLYFETNLSYPQIGQKMGKDHTSILHAVRSYMQANGITELPEHRR